MALSNQGQVVQRFRVEDGQHPYNPLHNTSEADLEKQLWEMRAQNKTFIFSDSGQREETPLDCSSNTTGIIVANVLGRLANDLFEAAFAKRMASELGCDWHVIYRTYWAAAFPNDRTDKCFPNALAENNNRRSSQETKRAIQIVNEASENRTDLDTSLLYGALTYNQLEPNKNAGFDNSDDKANKITDTWIKKLGETALEVRHMEYPLQGDHVDQLISKLKDPSSKVRVLNLAAFFIHFDWMGKWMEQISNWLRIDPSCCTSPPPSENAVVIHVRDFDPGENHPDAKYEVGVYRDIMNRYSNGNIEVMVVCQPKSVDSDIVKNLVETFNATVQTGNDNIDAFCILSKSRGMLILSAGSTFSQMAALLAQAKSDSLQVHYPTYTFDHPKTTLKVPGWKYHLANASQVIEYDFDHKLLKVSQA